MQHVLPINLVAIEQHAQAPCIHGSRHALRLSDRLARRLQLRSLVESRLEIGRCVVDALRVINVPTHRLLARS